MRSSDWSSDVCSSDLSSPVAAATSAADERRERPELDAGDDEREGEGAALAERSDHKPRTPRQPKEANDAPRSEEHTSELQSLMRISYAVFCLKKKTTTKN